MAAHWSTRDMFLAAAIPASISAIAMFSLRFVVGTKLGEATDMAQGRLKPATTGGRAG